MWVPSDEDENLGGFGWWQEAAADAESVAVGFAGQIHDVPVVQGWVFFAAWNVPAGEWPYVTLSNAERNRVKRQLKELTEILFTDWDPIGINDDPEAPRDEYESCSPQILALLREGADEGTLAICLREMAGRDILGELDSETLSEETNQVVFEVSDMHSPDFTAAQKILAWYEDQ